MDNNHIAKDLLCIAKQFLAQEITYDFEWYKKLLQLEPQSGTYIGNPNTPRIKTAFEFPNKQELDQYLKQHPDADKSKHWVKQEKKYLTKQPTIIPTEKNVQQVQPGEYLEESDELFGQLDKGGWDKSRSNIAGWALDNINQNKMMGLVVKDSSKKMAGIASTVYKKHKDGSNWLKVSCIATRGDTKGLGTEIMAQAIKKQAQAGMGVELRATSTAESYYEHIGMHLDPNYEKVKDDLGPIDTPDLKRYYFTPQEAKKFADTVLAEAESWKTQAGITSKNNFEDTRRLKKTPVQQQPAQKPVQQQPVQKPIAPKKPEPKEQPAPKIENKPALKHKYEPVKIEYKDEWAQVKDDLPEANEEHLTKIQSLLGDRAKGLKKKQIVKLYEKLVEKGHFK
jgi:hypothetical protein